MINVDEVMQLHNEGYSTKTIASKMDVSQRYIHYIIKDNRVDNRFGNTIHLQLFTPNDIAYIAKYPDKLTEVLERRYKDYYIKRDIVDSKYTLQDNSINARRKLRSIVLNRDGFKCTKCNSSISLETHHILPVSTYPELELTVDNCVTLCHTCHINSREDISIKDLVKHIWRS